MKDPNHSPALERDHPGDTHVGCCLHFVHREVSSSHWCPAHVDAQVPSAKGRVSQLHSTAHFGQVSGTVFETETWITAAHCRFQKCQSARSRVQRGLILSSTLFPAMLPSLSLLRKNVLYIHKSWSSPPLCPALVIVTEQYIDCFHSYLAEFSSSSRGGISTCGI